MKDKIFNEKEAVAVIQQMVNAGRHNLKQDAVHFLIWGWVILAGCLIHYLSFLMLFQQGVYIWPVVITIGIISSFYTGWQQGKQSRSTSYVDRMNRYLWFGSLAPFAIAISIGLIYDWFYAYPVFAAILGWGSFISGGLLKFKPLVWGGVAAWITGVFLLIFTGPEILLLMAVAILFSYLIPGHMMMKKA